MSVTTVVDDLESVVSAAVDDGARRGGRLSSGWGKGGGLALAVVALGLAVVASLTLGAKSIPFGDVVDAIFAFDPENLDHQAIRSLRLPRTMLGLAVGSALALAGAAMQGVTRNPLADTGIFGVNGGASLAVVTATTVFGVTSLSHYAWFALGGAAVATVIVYGLGSVGRGGATPIKLALAGAAIAAMLQALTGAILLFDTTALEQYRFWVVGSIAGRDTAILWQVLPFLVVGYVLSLAAAPGLNALALGDDMARSLGQRVHLARAVGGLAVVACAGAAVAAAGPIGFIGLTMPYVARSICGPDYRWIMPWSMVLGPTFLLVADVAGRLIARPGELQVGIATAFIGAPFFMLLVRRRTLAAL